MKLNAILKIQKSIAFISDLAQFVFDPNLAQTSKEVIQTASPSIKAVIHLYAFDQSVSNSGIMGWFLDVYDEHPDILCSFRLIGANHCADYFQAAIRLFPKSKVPCDISERLRICDSKEKAFDALDRQYSEATIAGVEALRHFIREHLTLFESDVHSFWALASK